MLNRETKILYITGTRADYGLMRHSLLTINKLCNLEIVVTSMHLENQFGRTVDEIKSDNLNIIKNIQLLYKTDRLEDLPKNLGYLLVQLGDLVGRNKYDYILVEGDRMEALALAIAANSKNISVIHQGGGDVSGSIDGRIRDAITSFSDFHLVGNIRSAKRLESMGIPKKKIFMFGEPGLDDILNKRYLSLSETIKKYSIDKNKPLIIVVQHPDTKEKISARKQVGSLLETIKQLKIPSIVIFPNNDPGGAEMMEEFKKYKLLPFIKFFPTVPRTDFLGLINVCSIMVGNSSSGLVEAPMFNIPFINIGKRQENRLADTNVVNCNLNKDEIIGKIKENLDKKDKFNIKYVYGRGSFTKKFVKFLKTL